MNPRAGATDLLVFEARPFSHLGTPPVCRYCIVLHQAVYQILAPLSKKSGKFIEIKEKM